MELLTPVIVLTGISLFLGVLILVAGRILADYGDCVLTINGNREIIVRGGVSIHAALAANGIFVPSACGGKATCGLCKGRVLSGAGPLLPTERPFMNAAERANGTRLLCQVKIKKNTGIVIPESYFLVREFRATLDAVTPLTHDTRLFRFRLSAEAIKFNPGQFIQIRIPGTNEERAYSIASSPACGNVLELVVRRVPGGLCTSYLFDTLKPGGEIVFTGPYGEFYLREENDSPIVCVAGGSGSALIRSILSHLHAQGSQRTVKSFYGCRTPDDLYFTDEYARLSMDLPGLSHICAVSDSAENDGWTGERGLITTVMERNLGDLSGFDAYLCGPPAMIDAAIPILADKGVRPERIFYDKF